jgi:hypothetical protein
MNLHQIALEPAAAPPRHIGGLARFRQAQHVSVECSCLLFLTRWHRKLNVIDANN